MKNMATPTASSCRGRSRGAVMFLMFMLHHICKAQDESVPNAIDFDFDGDEEDIFTKPTLSLSPNGAPPAPTSLAPSLLLRDNSTLIKFEGHNKCQFARDIYCIRTTQKSIDAMSKMSNDEIEKDIIQTMVKELGVPYRPLIAGNIDYWTQNSTTDREAGLTGFGVAEGSEKFEVRALAMGVVIKSISNIDIVEGTFDATLKLFFYNITEGPFSTMEQAVDTIYNDGSKTTVKDRDYFRLHDKDFPDAWSKNEIGDGEFVHPDGVCSPAAMSSMQPILMDEFKLKDTLRLPHLKSRIFPEMVADKEGYLSYVEVLGAAFNFKPLNRKWYPVQIDMLDIFFEMGSTDLIHGDQRIVKHLLCLHPSFSGFSNDVFGSDAEAGLSTSDALTMIPHMFYERSEPWLETDRSQFHYDAASQKSKTGNGSNLQRMLGLRIIVEQPTSKGWFELLPILFVSLSAVANFVSSDPEKIGGTSMIQALLGVNSLVTQSSKNIGQKTVMGHSLLLAYAINGLWISTVVLMMLINQAKGHENRGKWYVLYQLKIFRYLRLLDASLCLLYIPFLSAYSIDKNNGQQSGKAWIWGLVCGFIMFLFVVRAVRDYQLIKKRKKVKETDTIKALLFSSKPLNLWSQDTVLRWINLGSMNRASYFSDAKRSSIAEKLEAACVDGELLSELDVDKLVQFVGLPFGDAVKLADELKFLVGYKTQTQSDTTGSDDTSALMVVYKGDRV